MLQVIKNFANSEKAVAVGVLVVAATVLTALGKMSIAEWQEYTMVMAGIYVAGKSAQGIAEKVSDAKSSRRELDALKSSLGKSDAAADAAVAEKFGEDSE